MKTALVHKRENSFQRGAVLYLRHSQPTPRLRRAKGRAVHCSLLRVLVLTRCVVSVKDAERQKGTIAMSCKRSLGQGCQVVHVVKGWPFMLVIASQEEVDMVWGLQGKNTAKWR